MTALIPQAPLARLFLAISLAAWALLVASPPGLTVPLFCTTGNGIWPALSSGVEMTLRLNPPAHFLASALLMLCAMMLPFAYLPIANMLAAHPAQSPATAAALFLTGFLAIWIAAIIAIAGFSALFRLALGGFALPIGIAIAVLWQMTRLKARCLARSLNADPHSDSGEVATGARSAFACLCSCWALMLLPYLAGQAHLAAMAAVAALMLIERRTHRAFVTR